MSTISQRIKELRKEKKYTQKQLAEKIGISEISIRKYESGDRIPKFEVIERLAEIFNVQFDYIIGRSNNKNFDSHIVSSDLNALLSLTESSKNPNITGLIRSIVDTMFLTIYGEAKDNNFDKLLLIRSIYRNLWEIKMDSEGKYSTGNTIEEMKEKQLELIDKLVLINKKNNN